MCIRDRIKEAIDSFGKDLEENVKIANIDYATLGENMDDMVKAYSLGLYDDDLVEEDPGTIVEHLEDFKKYNDEVEELKDIIEDFKLSNPVKYEKEQNEEKLPETDDNAMMTDIIEHDVPENYSSEEEMDLGLQQDKLQESINIEYHRLKEHMVAKYSTANNGTETERGEALEPIDEFGNLVTTSRFKSQRILFSDKR